MDWEEIKDLKTLATVKSVGEMMPKPLKNNNRSNGVGKAGRPSLTEEQFRVVEECLKMDCSVTEACDYAWISRSAYESHYRKDPDFALRMDRAKEFPKIMARTSVMRRIWQGDAKTALEYLKLRDKKRYNTVPWYWDEGEGNDVTNLPKVEFISVPSNEWVDQWKSDSQTHTGQNSAYDISVNSWESLTEKQTPWENEEDALKRLNSLNSNIG